MSLIAQYTAHLITGIAIFAAIFLHWKWPKRYWQPSFLTAVITSVAAYGLLTFVPRMVNGELIHSVSYMPQTVGFAFVSSFVLAMLVGYLMKFAPTLFGK